MERSKQFNQHRLVVAIFCLISLLTTSTVNANTTEPKASANINANTAEPKASAKDRESYLFVQSAGKAKIELVNKETKTYKVTLKQISSFVTYFSERPKRIANTMPIERFLKLWEAKGRDSFKDDAPNADFNGIQIGFLTPDKPLNIVLQLSQPVYDSKKQTLTYTANPLEGSTMNIPESATLNNVILFIDDACLSCW